MSINRWMDKEVVICIHNGILLSHKKECIWISSNEVDEPRAYYTEGSKSERERLISYTNIYMESRKIAPKNLFVQQQISWSHKESEMTERLNWTELNWIERHREQTYGHGERGGEGKMYGESKMETYITICKLASRNLLYGSGNSNRGSVSI